MKDGIKPMVAENGKKPLKTARVMMKPLKEPAMKGRSTELCRGGRNFLASGSSH